MDYEDNEYGENAVDDMMVDTTIITTQAIFLNFLMSRQLTISLQTSTIGTEFLCSSEEYPLETLICMFAFLELA